MESGSSQGCGSPECCLDFGFAFNNVKFSDKTLQIEIIPESHGSEPDPNDSLADWDRNRKRRCADGLEDSNGHEAVQSNGSPSSIDSYATQMKTIHVSSPILSAKSPFFYKLFSNGMAESNQQHVTLRIQESEESAFMDLLKYMYTNTLLRTTPSALLDVLMVADKFEVASCMRYCGRSLQKLPMTCESALLYLDLPSTIWISLQPMADIVQPLTDAAKEFIVARFKNISKFQEEMLNLHLAGIEAVLLSDELQVDSEDYIYDFVMKWARTHYTKSDERREILTTHLLRLIRFQFMSFRKLEKVLTCTDINLEISSKLVFHALRFKAGTPHRQPSPVSHIGNVMSRLVERAYEYRPVRVMRFDSPREECVVYLDLKREECARIFPSGLVSSEPFHLGRKVFSLIGRCNMSQHSSRHYFGCMFLMHENESAGIMFEVEFSARTKPSEEFVSKYKGNEFGGGKVAGCLNLFGVPWTEFVAEDSPYFINGVLHLRAELKIKK